MVRLRPGLWLGTGYGVVGVRVMVRVRVVLGSG